MSLLEPVFLQVELLQPHSLTDYLNWTPALKRTWSRTDVSYSQFYSVFPVSQSLLEPVFLQVELLQHHSQTDHLNWTPALNGTWSLTAAWSLETPTEPTWRIPAVRLVCLEPRDLKLIKAWRKRFDNAAPRVSQSSALLGVSHC
ncbi:UNVERIFIED_CONTAM: hypothetical protein FKN15_013511 [Acipenser sinensis]